VKIIDNINNLLGDDIKSSMKHKTKVKMAASCFSIFAFEALKKELSKIDAFEFIFTSPTFVADEVTDKIKKHKREFFIPKISRENSLYGSEFEIQLRNKLNQRAIAKECVEWIKSKASFKSNISKSHMQQFICLDKEEAPTAYAPIQGFTAVDLGYQKGDSVSNFVNCFDEKSHADKYLGLFNQIWNDPDKLQDVTNTICEHIESVYQENSPEKIYFIILYNIFSDFLEDINEDMLPNDRTGYQDTLVWKKLFNYQKDASIGIINKLETYNGCILADSVGLGKTFTALAVVKYYELRNKSVLVLCPKKLAENWLNYKGNLKTNIFQKDRFNYDVLCHTDLSRESGSSLGMKLNLINWGNYDLVVIDESHNFRNNDVFKDKETRYQKLMNKVIKEGVRTKVLMLSATPVNNKFADLKNQLEFAYEGESKNLSKNLKTKRSIEDIFRRAQLAFNRWSDLEPEHRTSKAILESLDFDFFEMLDSVTIARSRKHIETFYDTSDIGKFPERKKPLSFHSPLTKLAESLSFNEIFSQLSLLKLCVYAPISYILPSRLKKYEELYDTEIKEGKSKFKQIDRERSLQALMTTNLLKRLESSVEAFRLTLGSLQKNINNTIELINEFQNSKGKLNVSDFTNKLENLEADEDDITIPGDIKVGGKVQIRLSDMDVELWKNDLATDLFLIETLLTSMRKITPENDEKLQHLKELISQKIDNPINDGNKKIIIFSAFADTANYLYENIAQDFLEKKLLHSAKITGGGAPLCTIKKGYDFQSILTLFSPRSKEKHLIMPEEKHEIDILIATDCISEGQNLQDCDYLINYDIHWNPVRIIQRFGRIDRIGSPNKTIQLVNYWPDITLDEYINLKERVENRMMIADAVATGDDNVLTSKSSDISYRKEQLRKLQEEVIEMEDLKTGVSITDLGLNDFRMDLLNYVKTHGDIKDAPKGMHAVVEAKPELGLQAGVIFVLRNINDGININQQNRLHPYYLVYLSKDGEVIVNHTEAKKLLDLVRTSSKGIAEPIKELCNIFNEETNDGKSMGKYSDLLNKAIGSMIDLKEEKDIDSLFSGGRTTALLNTISDLDDFELIAFLVIQEKQ
jgi:SNF2 family DNA or RNA helicase